MREAISLERHSLVLSGTEVTYFRGGQGPTLIYLHGGDGLFANARMLDAMRAHFDVIAPVHPGFEQSPMPSWMDSIDDYAHLYIQLADALDCRGALLAGTSIGAWIAAEIITKNRTRIGGLVMASPVGIKLGAPDKLDIPDIFAMREAALDKIVYHDAAKWTFDAAAYGDDELLAIARNRETLALVTWEPYMHNPKLRYRLAGADVPALFVRGASDGIVSHDYISGYAGLFADARIETIAACGHLPHIEQPDAFCDAIRSFASELQSREPAR